jgi:hypothetical protein
MKFLAAALVAGVMACAGSTRTVVRYREPPPARDEVITYRPGYFWVHGRWAYDRGRWGWRGGYYEPERRGQVWTDGHWERRGGDYVWVDGGWRVRGGVVIR